MKNSVRFPHLKACFLFDGLGEHEAASFLDGCAMRVYRTAQEVLMQGVLPEGVFIIASGSVEISCDNEAGDRAIITHLTEGQTVGEPEVIAQMPCVGNALARPDTVMLFCPEASFLAFLQHDVVVRNIMRAYVERLRRDNWLKAVDQFQPVEMRIASYLKHLSQSGPVIRVSQAYLATAAGCSRQTVNKVLGRLKANGVIALRKGEIEILLPRGLEVMFSD